MDFLGLKIAAVTAVLVGLGLLYRKYKQDTNGADLTVDGLLNEANVLLKLFEDVVAKKAGEVEQYIVDALNLDELKKNAEAELERAKAKAEKIKQAIID